MIYRQKNGKCNGIYYTRVLKSAYMKFRNKMFRYARSAHTDQFPVLSI
jgi:hypothetical protein